jgi:uncharacterized protein YuzE
MARRDGRGTILQQEASQMKLTYNPELNIAYLQLRKKSGKVRTVQVNDELNVDLAKDGTIFGIELLNANEQLAKGKNVILENLKTGHRRKFSMAS